MENLFLAVNNKSFFICGDFNTDLLNPNKHKLTDELIERMHSMSLIPTIPKPSITSHSATLIDDILTNNLTNNLINGLLICDIVDHCFCHI